MHYTRQTCDYDTSLVSQSQVGDGNVFTVVCLSVYLFVSRITQKSYGRFSMTFYNRFLEELIMEVIGSDP